jgi:hypothetical protein
VKGCGLAVVDVAVVVVERVVVRTLVDALVETDVDTLVLTLVTVLETVEVTVVVGNVFGGIRYTSAEPLEGTEPSESMPIQNAVKVPELTVAICPAFSCAKVFVTPSGIT